MEELPTELSNTKTRKLRETVREYSRRLGLKDPGDRFSAKQHIIRVCGQFPRIRAYVRPLGGKLTREQQALFFRYMVENPIGDFVVNAQVVAPKPPRDNPRAARRKLSKAAKMERAKRELFYDSWEWQKVRYQVLKTYGPRCMLCEATRSDKDMYGKPVRIVVDHVLPLATHWEKRLDISNLQVLCYDCNKGKGAWDQSDFRPKAK